MKRTLTGTLVAVVAGAAMVAAQANAPRAGSGSDTQAPKAPSSQAQSSSQAGAKSSDKDTVTYTGCLETGAAPGTFVLTNASASSQAKPATQPAGAAATTIAEEKFLLSGAPSSFNMSTNVNHKIEITGVVADMGSVSSAASARPSSPAMPPASPNPDKPAQPSPQVEARTQTPSSASMEAGLRTITVRSAKVLSDRCSTTF